MAVVHCSAPRSLLCHGLAGLALLIGLAACSEAEPDAGADPAAARVDAPVARHAVEAAPAPSAASPAEPIPAPPTPFPPGSAELDPGAARIEETGVDEDGPRRPGRVRKGRPIEIVLRSSPSGAAVAVDGVSLGATPVIWEGFADATAREFTFALPGYAVARYRFVPIQSGIVHGTLEPIKLEGEDRPAGRHTVPPAPGK